ncbi:MAG: FAD-dependent thymidylate synthase [Clostridiales bacterium]|nr:FAD-dependent thymidylate synthase [Clostridiales bacterium]
MKVELLTKTQSAEEICTTAARTCYSSMTPEVLFHAFKKDDNVLSDIIASGHDSVLEHAVFTFAVSGVSRVTTHQLVRHRMASYEQQSQRYVNIRTTWEDIVVPPTVQDLLDAEWELANTISDEPLRQAIAKYHDGLYDLLIELNNHHIPSEDMRYFVPQGTKSNIVITMNARELRHFFSLRLCRRAQWEIRELALKMYQECIKVCPTLFKDVGPACMTGKCREGKRSCGKPITAKELEGENDTANVS